MEEPIILFEDRQVLVIRKPAGWLSQPDGTGREDVYYWGKNYIKGKLEKPGEVYLGICHRLDRLVAGILVLGKTSKASSRLAHQFLERKTKKLYLCLSEGHPQTSSGTLDYPVVRVRRKTLRANDEFGGKRAALNYKLIETGKIQGMEASLMEIELVTGFRHQIRAQLSDLGIPIVGDSLYGSTILEENSDSIGLFAKSLSFDHPITQERLTFESDPANIWPWNSFVRGTE
ncbi:MAG: RluA family pseudouridine synthase [Deltaproteobacteria bacterium]|jgi:23S rRNA pseudouridine1911/1915/1917 synthase|nr:RluA family pseudouridine synthase [Deltaproteobacteria bacterium]